MFAMYNLGYILLIIVKLAVIWSKVKDWDFSPKGHVTAVGPVFPPHFYMLIAQHLGAAVLSSLWILPLLRISVLVVSFLLAFGIMANTSTKLRRLEGQLMQQPQ